MVSNATSTGIPNDTVKKRKGAPSANEIFSDPVPATDETMFNGNRIQNAPKRKYVSQPSQVLKSYFSLLTVVGIQCGGIDTPCDCGNIHVIVILHEIVSDWRE